MSYLSFEQASQSPCEGCAAPCCTFLPLHDFVIQHLDHLDYALYLVNFANIELALVNGTTWRVHYRQRCSRLMPNGGCQLHGQPQKPLVCQNYSATSCFYKPMFIYPETAAFLRFDAVRLRAYADLLTFDEDRNVVGVPDVNELQAILPDFVVSDVPPVSPPTSSVERGTFRFMDFPNPCDGCSAWCCSTLSFPFAGISSRANLDYLWFCLGFPGVRLNVNGEQWSILVETHCRHLQREEDGKGRCGIFGEPHRPLQCSTYDATQCGYKQRHLRGTTQLYPEVSLENFATLAEQYRFDDVGQLLQAPTVEMLQQALL